MSQLQAHPCRQSHKTLVAAEVTRQALDTHRWLDLPRAAALLALTKPRLATFSVLTAMAAYAATRPAVDVTHALATLAGTTLAAGGALSLNQWRERDIDGRMRRTCARPLPRKEVTPVTALAWSVALGVAGVVTLVLLVNAVAGALAAATIAIYGFVYTPLKRRTRWATEIGAIAGALPPLLGGAAAGDALSDTASTLAAILLCWQMPHFFAIGWIYRGDYRAAGFRLLPATDATGARTAAWSLGYTIALVVVSIFPCVIGGAGTVYAVSATGGGLFILQRSWRFWFASDQREPAARRLFVASTAYLPLMIAALVTDRLF